MARTSAAKADLSRSAIVERALAVADAEGLGAVTVRRIAQDFGVTPMALYWHVSNKDELLAAMGEQFFVGIETLPAEATWNDDLRAIMYALVGSLRRHPASAPLAAYRVMTCESGLLLAERVLGLLLGAGFSQIQASDIARTAMQTAVMLVTTEAGSELEVPQAERDAHMLAKRAELAKLPPDRFPFVLACADSLTDCEDEQAYYDFGIDLFITGVEQLNARVAV
jgi:TetR/AcrR family transcriptional regulator, tetracycline repressor protein